MSSTVFLPARCQPGGKPFPSLEATWGSGLWRRQTGDRDLVTSSVEEEAEAQKGDWVLQGS